MLVRQISWTENSLIVLDATHVGLHCMEHVSSMHRRHGLEGLLLMTLGWVSFFYEVRVWLATEARCNVDCLALWRGPAGLWFNLRRKKTGPSLRFSERRGHGIERRK